MARKTVVSKDVKVNKIHLMTLDVYSLLLADTVVTKYGDVDESKVCAEYGAVYAETLDSYSEIFAVDADTFRNISFIISDDESRRNLITRTVTSNVWTVFTVDRKTLETTKREYVFDSRSSEKEVLKATRGQMAMITGKVEELRGCTLETFMQYAKPHTR